MRPTWHFVTPADIRWLLTLTAPRVHAVNAFMYRQVEVDDALFSRSDDTLVRALQGGNQLTRDELRDALENEGIVSGNGIRMSLFMMHAELEGLICSGPRRGKQFTYALLDERVPRARTLSKTRDEALVELAGRYFLSRGPATVQDFAKWSGLTISDCTQGLEAVRERLNQEVVDGKSYWFADSGQFVEENGSTAYLLSIFDEYVSSYKDYSVLGNPDFTDLMRAMGNALQYFIIVNSQIAGTWKRSVSKYKIELETNTFRTLTDEEKNAVSTAADRYGDFFGLPVEVVSSPTSH
jgi:hypothetical protein